MSVEERLARIEEHSKQATENWTYIRDKLDNLPCTNHIGEIGKNTGFRKTAVWYIRMLIVSTVGFLYYLVKQAIAK